MKFIQLLVVLALCCSALAAAVSTTTTVVVSSSVGSNRAIYYQEAPKYVVTVTAASGSTFPPGTVTVTIGGNSRGQCTLQAGTTGNTVATCSIEDIKPSAAPNLPVGSNSATVDFTPSDSTAFSASQGTATFTVFALPVVLLTYNGASDDVNVSLPSGVTTLVSTIDTTNAGTQTAPAGTIVLSQTSTNSGFSNITCTVPTASPYTCNLAIPASYLTAGLNYTLLASFVPASGSVFGPDGSKSITLRILTTATTTTTTGATTSTTGVSTSTTGATTNAGVTTNSGATTTSTTGYASIVANLVFNGTCTANFNQTAFAILIANFNGLSGTTGFNLTQIGQCVSNNNNTFYIQAQIQALNPSTNPIPVDFSQLLATFNAQLQANLGLTSAGIVIISTTPAPAAASTTSGTTGASATTTSGATATTAQTTASVTATATTQGSTVTVTGTATTQGTSAASSVVVGAAILLIFAALL